MVGARSPVNSAALPTGCCCYGWCGVACLCVNRSARYHYTPTLGLCGKINYSCFRLTAFSTTGRRSAVGLPSVQRVAKGPPALQRASLRAAGSFARPQWAPRPAMTTLNAPSNKHRAQCHAPCCAAALRATQRAVAQVIGLSKRHTLCSTSLGPTRWRKDWSVITW